MKQLLTIFLLFPLFIACSSDDDDKKEEGLTDAQKEAFLVGQWSKKYTIGGTLYVFGSDKSYRKYDIIGGNKIKLAEYPNSIGTYWVKGNYIWLENYEGSQSGTLFSIKDENTISFGETYTRDTTEYTL